MKSGERMSNKDYRDHVGISSTELKRMIKSPAHYKYYKEHPVESDSPSLLFGRAAHKYILETYDFYNEFSVMPILDRRTKAGKEMYAQFVAENEGKDIITQEQFEQIEEMRNSMLATPYVSKLILGDHEVSYFAKDEDTGLDIKARPDSINHKIGVIVDYKTCDNAETNAFMKKAIDLGYDLQAAYYCDIAKYNTGIDYKFVFIAQEKRPPYAVNILEADDYFMASGRELYKEMLQVYKECSETGNWYGYLGSENEINSLSVPKWIKESFGDLEGEIE